MMSSMGSSGGGIRMKFIIFFFLVFNYFKLFEKNKYYYCFQNHEKDKERERENEISTYRKG